MPITDRVITGNIVDNAINPFLPPHGEAQRSNPLEMGIQACVSRVRRNDQSSTGVLGNQARTELNRALDKLNRNLDRQISQGYMIKTYFPEVRF